MIFNTIEELLFLAEVQFKQEKLETAKVTLQKVLELDSKNSRAHELLAYFYAKKGDGKRAQELLIIACNNPAASAGALYELGSLYLGSKKYAQAIKTLQAAVDKNGPFFEGLHDLGLALAGNKCPHEAVKALEKAININPYSEEAYYNLAKIYEELKAFPKALKLYQKALKIRPTFIEALVNSGIVLHHLKRFSEAISCFEGALRLDEKFIDAWINLGFCLHTQKRFRDALAAYNQAILLEPLSAEAHWNKSLTLLILGDFVKGFEEFEWRLQSLRFSHKNRNFTEPAWDGKVDLNCKTILLYNEQGLGDSIQFSRYAQSLANLGAKVLLEADPSLYSLYTNLPGVYQLVKRGDQLPQFDYHSSLLSLPYLLKTSIENIPTPTNYLSSDPSKVSTWKLKLGDSTKVRIGIVWSSISTFEYDEDRSLDLEIFLKAFPQDKYDLICLQKIVKDQDLDTLHSRTDIQFFGPELNDFSDTAALIECVDLVISSCTSVPHLSGAMGKPTWLLLSHVADWRWLCDRKDSPWYKAVRLYRQKDFGDWDNVLQRISIDLGLHYTKSLQA